MEIEMADENGEVGSFSVRSALWQHGLWVFSRAALALAIVAITWVVEIPVGDFLRLKEALEAPRANEDRLIVRLGAGERTLNSAKIAVEHFSYAVDLHQQGPGRTDGWQTALLESVERAATKEEAMWEVYARDGPLLGYGETEVVAISSVISEGLSQLQAGEPTSTLGAKVELATHHLRHLDQLVRTDRERIEELVAREKRQGLP